MFNHWLKIFLSDFTRKSTFRFNFLSIALVVVLSFFISSDVCKGQNLNDSLRTMLKGNLTDSVRALTLLNLGYGYEADQPDSSIQIYERAFQLSEKIGFTIGKAKARQYKGIVQNELGLYSEAILNYFSALKLYEAGNDKKGIATTQNNLGNSYMYMGEFQESVEYYLKALPFFENEKNDYSLTVIYGNLCECYRQLKDFPDMLDAARKSFHHAQMLNEPVEIANAGISLGTALSLNNQNDSAVVYLEQSLALGKELKDPSIEYYALMDLANEDLKNGKPKEAMIKADSVMTKAKLTLQNFNVIAAHNLRGKCFQELKKKKEALVEFTTALEMARQDKAQQQELETLDLLSKYYESIGNFKEAMRWRYEWIDLNDKIFNETKSRIIPELRGLHATIEKENLLAEEREKSAGKDNKIQNKYIYLLEAALALILILFSIIFSIKANRSKRKLTDQTVLLEKESKHALEKEQESLKLRSLIEGQEIERHRIGRELYDGLGGMLTAARMQLEQLGKESGKSMPVDKYLNLQNLITKAGKEMRQISHDLVPEGLDKLGLSSSLEQYCKSISTSELTVGFESSGESWTPSAVEDVPVFRTVQELLNNVLKHADATEAFVSLSYLPDALTLTVEDNGMGFDVKDSTKKGKGLSSIAARVAYLHGTMDIVSKTIQGTSITISIPYYGK